MVAPSESFRIVGHHNDFLWQLLPPGLDLHASEMSQAGLLVADQFLKALGQESGPSNNRHLGTAVATHAARLDGLKRKDPESYGLLIQARFGDFIDRVPHDEPDNPLRRLVQNHALFMAMHAAKIIGMLSRISRRNPMPSVVDAAGGAVKVGASMRTLKEKAINIHSLLASVTADLCGAYHNDKNIYNNGLFVAGIDVMPFARRMEQSYRDLPKIRRGQFKKDLGRIVAQCDRQTNLFIAEATSKGGSEPIEALFPHKELDRYRPQAMKSYFNGYTELLEMWTGFSPTQAVAAAGISLAISLHEIPTLIEKRRMNTAHEKCRPPYRVWPKCLPYGSAQLAFSVCEVLRSVFTHDKDIGLKISATAQKDDFSARSPDAGRTLVKKALLSLSDPIGPDPQPVTVQLQRWFFPTEAELRNKI